MPGVQRGLPLVDAAGCECETESADGRRITRGCRRADPRGDRRRGVLPACSERQGACRTSFPAAPSRRGLESGKPGVPGLRGPEHGETTARVVAEGAPRERREPDARPPRGGLLQEDRALTLDAPALARCYGVVLSESDGAFHLLLEDPRASHRKLESDFVSHPGEPAIHAMIQATAPVHAAWWEHPSSKRWIR